MRPFFGRKVNHRHRMCARRVRYSVPLDGLEATLADVHPGCRARVSRFLQDLPPDRQSHLQAYGLVPGYWVRVVQHSPVTVVRIENTELALENSLARKIAVDLIEPV